MRDRIVDAVGARARALHLESCRTGCFADTSRGVIRMLTVSFLDRRHAGSFGTSTASFSLEVGVWYSGRQRIKDTPAEDAFPDHFECHVRHLLKRDSHQAPPSPDLSDPDKARRDIWWVDSEEDGLDQVIANASAAVARQGHRFYSRFSRPKTAERYFRMWWLTHRLPGAPFNIGRPGSPAHHQLLAALGENIKLLTQ